MQSKLSCTVFLVIIMKPPATGGPVVLVDYFSTSGYFLGPAGGRHVCGSGRALTPGPGLSRCPALAETLKAPFMSWTADRTQSM